MNDILKEKIQYFLEKGRAVIAVDGMCAAGKSTLADDINACFGGTVIRADSFFLPAELRSDKRLGEPGGNFHRERFYAEVVQSLKHKKPFFYGVYDCKCSEITKHISVNEKKLIIIEGSYCMHPLLCADYDLQIFCRTDEKSQLERIRRRNGEAALAVFEEKWIPLENRYFSTYSIQKFCDITVVT